MKYNITLRYIIVIYTSLLISISYYLSSCKTIKTTSPFCGEAATCMYSFDSTINEYVKDGPFGEFPFYYKDSLIIVKQQKFSTVERNDTLISSKMEIAFYHFADLRTNTAINFKNFSDTASVLKTHKIRPLTDRWSVWSYYGYVGFKNFDSASVQQLTDTIIDAVPLKRFLANDIYKSENRVDTVFNIFYVNCSSKFKIFQFDAAFSKKFANGCPVQMYDSYWPNIALHNRLKFEFRRNTLTPQELKVFATWEKFAKEHPAPDSSRFGHDL